MSLRRKLTGFIVFSFIMVLIFFINCTGVNAGNESAGTSQIPALCNLELSSGELAPSFAADTTSYTANVTYDIYAITVTSTAIQNDSLITVNGVVVTSGHASETIDLNVGLNTITIEVTSADNLAKITYTVSLTRASSPYLTELMVKKGIKNTSMSPAFNSKTLQYEVNVNKDTTSVNIFPTAEGGGSTTIKVNDNTVVSGQRFPVLLNPGDNYIYVDVTSAVGIDKKEYVIKITKAKSAFLSNLTISSGKLAPAYLRVTSSYKAQVSCDVSKITLTPTAEDSNATITVNGIPVSSGQESGLIDLSFGTNSILVQVTSALGDIITYNITVTRETSSYLSGLTLNSGSITPLFANRSYFYDVNVENSVSSIAITSMAEDSDATIRVNDMPVKNGQESLPINLDVGLNTIIVEVTPLVGNTTTYTIKVERASTPYLLDIAASSGTLSPAFEKTNYSYTVKVGNDVSAITLTPIAEDEDSSITVNGDLVESGRMSETINLNEGVNIIPVQIIRIGGVPVTYTVTVIREKSPCLKGLEVGVGIHKETISPMFNNEVREYTVNVNKDTSIVNIRPLVENNIDMIMKVNNTLVANGQYVAVPVSPGNTDIYVIVESATSGDQRIYVIKVTRPRSASLSNLTISSGKIVPVFSSVSSSYAVNVENGISSIVLTPTAEDTNAAITVNSETVGNMQSSTPIDLNVGVNTITVEVTAADGSAKMSYVITVTRAGSMCLSELSINGIVLTPIFSKNIFSYNASVAYDVSSISVTPTAEEADATIVVNGTEVISGQSSNPVNLNVGSNIIAVKVTSALDSIGTTYTIKVTRASSSYLSALAFSNGTLDHVFSRGDFSYTSSVAYDISSITVTPTSEDSRATITVNGTAMTSGQSSNPINLNVGDNTITVEVIPVNGDIATYTINVTRAHSPYLSNLILKKGFTSLQLSPTFAKTINAYTANVWYDTSSIIVIPTAEDLTSVIKINGVVVSSGQPSHYVSLNVGINLITVHVTTQDGSVKTYTISVARADNPYLSNLSVSDGVINPIFSKYTYNYTVSVGYDTTHVTVNPVAENSNATITVNGVPVVSGQDSEPINLNVGLNTIIVQVTPAIGTTTTYTITVTRINSSNLSKLAVKSGTTDISLSPSFSKTATSYTAIVGYDVPSITVIPTVEDNTSTITVNGESVIKGQASIPIDLIVGTNPITVEVTTADGTMKSTYIIIITRECSGYLSMLSISDVALNETFEKTMLMYTANVADTVASTMVIPTVEDTTAVITVNGLVVSNNTDSPAIPLNEGSNTITIVVTPIVGNPQTYTIAVTRAIRVYLSNLSVVAKPNSGGTLVPTFVADITDYHISVPAGTTMLAVTATAPSSSFVITINNSTVTSGVTKAIPYSSTVIIKVTYGGVTKTYTVTVDRGISHNANLSALVLSNGTLTPAFASGTTTYVANVEHSISSITMTPTVADSRSTVKVNGKTVISGQASEQINLNVGSNLITVEVTPEYGVPKTYTIYVTRASSPYLSNLSMSNGTLNPVFIKTQTAYTANVDFDTECIALTATAEGTNALITINGIVVESGQASPPIDLNVGSNTITVEVTDAVTGTKQVYAVTVTRSANLYLSGLRIKYGKASVVLTPAFDKTVTEYTGVVARGTSLSVTATAEAPNDVFLKINMCPATSGAAINISVTPGTTNLISIVVTSKTDGSTKTYICNIMVGV